MTTQFSISSEVHATPGDDDGSVLINLHSGKVFSLNGVGARIWTMLEQGTTFEAIVDSLARHYDGSEQEIREDLNLFLRVLEKKGLVRENSNSGIQPEKPTNGLAA